MIHRHYVYTALTMTLAVITLCLCAPETNAKDSESSRSWIEVEVPYFGENSIYIKLVAHVAGNHLNHGMWIHYVVSEGNPRVEVGRFVAEAKYSPDVNMTEFSYTLSTQEYNIQSSGYFPADRWSIKMELYTNFFANFDPRVKYCSIPSQNYLGNYNTTYTHEDEDNYYCTLYLDIAHPPSFVLFVSSIFGTSIVALFVLASFCIHYLVKHRHDVEALAQILIPVASAVIVFVPVFQLAKQGLKTPFAFTIFDFFFLILLLCYVAIVCGVLFLKTRTRKKTTINMGLYE